MQRGGAKGAEDRSVFFCPAPPAQMNIHRKMKETSQRMSRTHPGLIAGRGGEEWTLCPHNISLSVNEVDYEKQIRPGLLQLIIRAAFLIIILCTPI